MCVGNEMNCTGHFALDAHASRPVACEYVSARDRMIRKEILLLSQK